MFGCAGSSLLLLVAVSRGYSLVAMGRSLVAVASVVAEQGCRHVSFNSCGAQA